MIINVLNLELKDDEYHHTEHLNQDLNSKGDIEQMLTKNSTHHGIMDLLSTPIYSNRLLMPIEPQ